MDFYDGIFDKKFQINKLQHKYYLMPLGEIDDLKLRLEKTINQSPRLIKNKKMLQLIANENKIKNLEATYNFHKIHHPFCPVLPKIHLEIKRRLKIDKISGALPCLKPKMNYSRPTVSVTPDPRLKYGNNFIINSVKVHHYRKNTE